MGFILATWAAASPALGQTPGALDTPPHQNPAPPPPPPPAVTGVEIPTFDDPLLIEKQVVLATSAHNRVPSGNFLPAAGDLGLLVREGYELTRVVSDLPNARFLIIDKAGTLYVSRPRVGEITALVDEDKDGIYEKRFAVVRERPSVHGLAIYDNHLYFTQTGGVFRIKLPDAGTFKTDGTDVIDVQEVIPAERLALGGAHWWRSILVTQSGIYTSVGDSGNITDELSTTRQKILRFNHDGTFNSVFAWGVRNTEKLQLQPGTDTTVNKDASIKEIWGVDHGSDWFGAALGERKGAAPITDENPPDELNRYVEGGFYGHPFLTGSRIPRPEYSLGGAYARRDLLQLAGRTTKPEWTFQAHSAANAFTFVDPAKVGEGKGLPQDHAGDMFVAQRGSWNRQNLAGYAIVRVLFEDGQPYGEKTIVRAIIDNEATARPVDCTQDLDGSILWSCDAKGAVYRVKWVGKKAAGSKP